VMEALKARGKVTIGIEKKLPVQGGLGAASSNAVAAMVGLERVLKKSLSDTERLRIAVEVGSDLPLFLIGGTVLGVGRGEEVYPVPDLPSIAMVVVTPEVGVSTPQAFADWDARAELTHSNSSDRLFEVGCALSAWLSHYPDAGAPAKSGGRAGSLLSDLVRAGIENDFERVVFPKYPELREIKSVLKDAGAVYDSLSGSGSAVYGLFKSGNHAKRAAAILTKKGTPAVATTTLTRPQYWKKMSD
jgi:4-diphosphocytidyl-2-C-methyl-D-erythritol kinase